MPFQEDDIDVAALSAFLRRHRRTLGLCLLVAIALSIGVAIALPRTYTTTTSFIPQGRTQTSALASIASQFGFSVPFSDATRSPSFYSALLLSKNVVANVLQRTYRTSAGDGAKSMTLVEYLRGRGENADQRRHSASAKLLRRVSVGVDQKAGMVRLEVQLRDPLVSRDVAQAFIAEVDSFNLRSRQSQASSERRFTEGRVAEARAEARQADDELQAFLQRNRDFRTSPQLTFTYDRLVNNVNLRQQIYTSVAQAYEQARIEEVRDTPVITVVEAPMLPARPDPRPFGRALTGGLLLGCLAGWLLGKRADRIAARGV
jgi:uncharacterized protein involved in exopolysaccharide biosynthesis